MGNSAPRFHRQAEALTVAMMTGGVDRYPPELFGMLSLWAEVLRQGVLAAAVEIGRVERGVPMQIAASSTAGALDWMYSDNQAPRSFAWACSLFGLDPERVRRAVYARRRDLEQDGGATVVRLAGKRADKRAKDAETESTPAARLPAPSQSRISRTCVCCGGSFLSMAANTKYCGRECRNKARSVATPPPPPMTCAECGVEFVPISSQQLYCDAICRQRAKDARKKAKQQTPEV